MAAPEIVIEILSPGSSNQRRDRQIKLSLYSAREVGEYWIVIRKTALSSFIAVEAKPSNWSET